MLFLRMIFLSLLICISYNIYAQAPGGVSAGLVLWVKANAGISSTADGSIVSDWFDQSTNTADLIAGNTPLYVQVCSNYNPGVLYDASSYHASGLSIPVSNSSLFVAGIPMAASSSDVFRIPWASDAETAFPLAIYNGALGHYTVTGSSPTGQPSSFIWADDETSFAREHIYSSNDADISKQGGPVSTLTSAFGGGGDAYYYLGSDPNVADGPEGFGKITESIIYDNATMDPTDIRKIESYLGLKYSVTLDNSAGGTAGDYLLSDGTTVWDADDQPSCHQGVIGLIRDDVSGLLQKQSHTQDDKIRVFLDALAIDNVSNAGTITNDLSSLVIGNNGGLLQDDATLTRPTGIYHMFGRVWKITNTNFTDNFSVEIKWDSVGNFDINDIRLLISTSPDMSGATIYDGNGPLSITLGSIIIGGLSSIIAPNTTVYIGIGSATITTTLPIVITAFTARPIENNKVALSWQTSSEHNNDYFMVERSADGNQWEPVIKVNSLGNAGSLQSYSTADSKPYTGVSYYRLKQTDLDGHYQYSAARAVKIDNPLSNGLVLYPNPLVKQLIIKASNATELKTMRIFSINGQDVTNLAKIISKDSNNMVLDLSALGAGIYQIKTTSGTHKIIKQ